MDELDQQVDTTTETTTTGAETSVDSEVDKGGDQPQPSSDWRVNKYGAEWEASVDYWRDTNKYLRGELDKAKKVRPQRGLEDDDAPARTAAPVKEISNGKSPEEIESVKDLLEHVKRTTEDSLEQRLSEREKRTNFRSSMATARENFSGEDGFPSFTELEQEFLIPLVKSSPHVLELLRELPDPGKGAMTLALVLKAKNPDGLRKMFAADGYKELTDKIDATTKEAVRVKGGKSGATTAKLTPEQIASMPAADFEKLVNKNTGRSA